MVAGLCSTLGSTIKFVGVLLEGVFCGPDVGYDWVRSAKMLRIMLKTLNSLFKLQFAAQLHKIAQSKLKMHKS